MIADIVRIIPAYAGSTRDDPPQERARGDHPRIRGEHSLVHTDEILKPGSSPHTRGALKSRFVDNNGVRIIPAYAGSTRDGIFGDNSLRDHPRIRGEHVTPP